ncbi:c-type cytochrome biogenesis protein CcmI [Colwellia sp. UCD-KL20]|uniref:c-type cytochrome biogenesis protein CcmI n=1 Tax=Colwellia sp. UCD-KL20 TaxID=1917165 RepID=UPI0009707C0C|nr:c-type cytochrome biogenesis protein CcmI [Colwellia sp. UCD-KL20]
MPELIILIVAFLLLILVVIWWHFIKQNNKVTIVDNTQRDDTNVRLYHEHKAEIENDFKQGSIDDENYQYLIAELDKSLLQDIEENKKASAEEVIESKTISVIWPIILTVFVLIFSFVMYNHNGAYKQLSQPLSSNQHAGAEMSEQDQAQQMIAQIKSLIDLTVNEPDNSDAWYGLGQAFINIGEFNKAIESFDQVIRIEGESAELYGAKAQAYYYKDNQTISSDVQEFIDKALALNPADASTNILIGMHNFMNQNYEVAIKHWETVINAGKPNVNTQALSEAVAEAKNRLLQAANGQMEQGNPAQINNDQTDIGPQLTVNVDISENIKQQLIQGEDKVVFIYAVSSDAKHGRMPVAAVKMKASDLPVTVVLNDSKAMSPQAKISDVPAVNIYAVISASGSVGVKSGDFKAERLNTDVLSTEPVSLLIDTIVP